MIRETAALIYFFLPAGAANSVPVVLTRAFGQGRPIHTPLFGNHKSWRGLVAGTAAGFLVFAAQRSLSDTPALRDLSAIDYRSAPLALGALMGAGALLGDLAKSLFKRLLHLPPGYPWIPFDQIGYIIGAIIATRFLVPLTED